MASSGSAHEIHPDAFSPGSLVSQNSKGLTLVKQFFNCLSDSLFGKNVLAIATSKRVDVVIYLWIIERPRNREARKAKQPGDKASEFEIAIVPGK